VAFNSSTIFTVATIAADASTTAVGEASEGVSNGSVVISADSDTGYEAGGAGEVVAELPQTNAKAEARAAGPGGIFVSGSGYGFAKAGGR
jgi:hypothetical protein